MGDVAYYPSEEYANNLARLLQKGYIAPPINEEELFDDPVNHPRHYTTHPSKVECIDITRHMSFNLGNVVKYVWRDGLKESVPDIQDLEKAAWYLNDEIKKRKSNL